MAKYIPINQEGCRAIYFAMQEAERWNTDYVAPEHFLLSLLQERSSVACRILAVLGIDTADLRQQTERRLQTGPGRKDVRVHLTEQSKRMADRWPGEATSLGNDWIGTEHQFLALIGAADGVVADVLRHHGITREVFRAEVVAVQQKP